MSGQEFDLLIVTALKDELDALEERIHQHTNIELNGIVPNWYPLHEPRLGAARL